LNDLSHDFPEKRIELCFWLSVKMTSFFLFTFAFITKTVVSKKNRVLLTDDVLTKT